MPGPVDLVGQQRRMARARAQVHREGGPGSGLAPAHAAHGADVAGHGIEHVVGRQLDRAGQVRMVDIQQAGLSQVAQQVVTVVVVAALDLDQPGERAVVHVGAHAGAVGALLLEHRHDEAAVGGEFDVDVAAIPGVQDPHPQLAQVGAGLALVDVQAQARVGMRDAAGLEASHRGRQVAVGLLFHRLLVRRNLDALRILHRRGLGGVRASQRQQRGGDPGRRR